MLRAEALSASMSSAIRCLLSLMGAITSVVRLPFVGYSEMSASAAPR